MAFAPINFLFNNPLIYEVTLRNKPSIHDDLSIVTARKMANLADTDNKLNHLFEESAAMNVYNPTTVNLAAGCPGPDLLSVLPDIMTQATCHRMEEEANNNYYLFQYGPTAGLWPAREAFARFLTKNYGSQVKRENIVLTSGATHGLHLAVSVLLAANAVIFVEEYTYMIALQLFREFPNHLIIPIPMDSNGVNTDELRNIATRIKNERIYEVNENKPYWSLFYTIPVFHNPTGTVLPPDRCRAVVDISKELNMLVICDDVYNLLYYGDEAHPPARLFSYAGDGGNIISNGSFSKILAPGLRVGWMELPTKLAHRFRRSGIMQSGGSVNNVMFGILQSVIEMGFADNQLTLYKQLYKERMTVFTQTLQENLPENCSFVPSDGGYFVWLTVPVDAAEFITWCMQNGGPGALPSSQFTVASTSPFDNQSQPQNSNAIRFSIGFHHSDILRTAAKNVCEKLKDYMDLLN